jgi:phage-related minor tail protein
VQAVSNAQGPKPFFAEQQIEQFNRSVAVLGRHAQDTMQAITTAFTPMAQCTVKAMEPLIDLANSTPS